MHWGDFLRSETHFLSIQSCNFCISSLFFLRSRRNRRYSCKPTYLERWNKVLILWDELNMKFCFIDFMLFHYISLSNPSSRILTLRRSVWSRGRRCLYLTCVDLVFDTFRGIEIKYPTPRNGSRPPPINIKAYCRLRTLNTIQSNRSIYLIYRSCLRSRCTIALVVVSPSWSSPLFDSMSSKGILGGLQTLRQLKDLSLMGPPWGRIQVL